MMIRKFSIALLFTAAAFANKIEPAQASSPAQSIDDAFVSKMVAINMAMACRNMSGREYGDQANQALIERKQKLYHYYGSAIPKEAANINLLRVKIDKIVKAKVKAMTPHGDLREIPSCARSPRW